MASMFQMQLARYGNDHNILHIRDNILPIYSKTWVSKSVIFPLLLVRIITGNNNNELLYANHVLQLSTSFHITQACPPGFLPGHSHKEMETLPGDLVLTGLLASLEGLNRQTSTLWICPWTVLCSLG